MGAIKKDNFFYDVKCDRCGRSLAEDLTRRDPYMARIPSLYADGFDPRVWGKIRERFLKLRKFVGWRFNPRNCTVVCPACPLIISKKGTKK